MMTFSRQLRGTVSLKGSIEACLSENLSSAPSEVKELPKESIQKMIIIEPKGKMASAILGQTAVDVAFAMRKVFE
jgi:hypothetical protein